MVRRSVWPSRCQVVRNRAELMVLPAGASKGTGLLAAVDDLGMFPHNVVAAGDAEDDLPLFNRRLPGDGGADAGAEVWVDPKTYVPIKEAIDRLPLFETAQTWIEYKTFPITPANERLVSLTARHPSRAHRPEPQRLPPRRGDERHRGDAAPVSRSVVVPVTPSNPRAVRSDHTIEFPPGLRGAGISVRCRQWPYDRLAPPTTMSFRLASVMSWCQSSLHKGKEPDVTLNGELHRGYRPSLGCDELEAMLINSMSVSVDGLIADREGAFGWTVPSEEQFRFRIAQTRELGGYLCGRRLYETMLPWDTDPSLRDTELGAAFADVWCAIPKVVFSRTLDSPAGYRIAPRGRRSLVISPVACGGSRRKR
jgi:RibD C-terminal domain